MSDQVFQRIRRAPGRLLDRPAYHADSDAEQAELTGGVIWKLERSQVFNEVGDPAWDAFTAGDWPRVTEIFESERDAIRAEVRGNTEQGVEFRRLRIVEHPPTPYLQWESHSHRIFVECGHLIRALDAARVAPLETVEPLPELMVYGNRVLYQVRYDDVWTPVGAKRVDDPELVAQAADAIARLWRHGEPFAAYFDREIAGLPTPTLTPRS